MFFEDSIGAPPTVTAFSWAKLTAEEATSEPPAIRAAVRESAIVRLRCFMGRIS
jgi:hypothetical protein